MSSAATTPAPHLGSQALLEALYVVNKHAKRLANTAATATDTFDRDRARQRKVALYHVKHQTLEAIAADAERVELHEIRDNEYYCFYFGKWSFHAPRDEIDAPMSITGIMTLPDFGASSVAMRSQLSLAEALRRLNDGARVNANDHLDRRELLRYGQFIDVGWPELDAE